MHKQLYNATLTAAILVTAAGCWHARNFATSDAKDYGQHLRTRYRYWVVHGNKEFSEKFERLNPDVFSQDGIPIAIRTYQGVSPSRSWSYLDGDDFFLFDLLYFCCWLGTGGIVFPLHMRGNEQTLEYSIDVLGTNASNAKVRVFEQNDKIAGTIVPCLCYHGSPAPDSFSHGRSFETHEYRFGNGSDAKSNFSTALAYGVASKLKELEEGGIINECIANNATNVRKNIDSQRRHHEEEVKKRQEEDRRRKEHEAWQRQIAAERKQRESKIQQTLQRPDVSPQSAQPPYRIVHLERDGSSDFAYRFALVLNGEPSIQTFFGIQKVFADEVRSAYHLEYPNADLHSLRIAVQPRLVNGQIEGRASVLTINPVSLSYDPNTRRGKLAVKFNAGQAEEARAWIRKNIETLARDKNIALTAGQLPPAATYYSLGEKIDGNVMEIEFKTE